MIARFAILALAASAPVVAQTAPAGGPQPITKAAFTAEIDKGFATVDANKDGFIDRAELSANDNRVLANAKANVLRESEAAFKKLDTDGNGSLSMAEFNVVAQSQTANLRTEDPAKMIGAFDTNKDSKISKAENLAKRMTVFNAVDTNKDGTLSPAEQAAARRGR